MMYSRRGGIWVVMSDDASTKGYMIFVSWFLTADKHDVISSSEYNYNMNQYGVAVIRLSNIPVSEVDRYSAM